MKRTLIISLLCLSALGSYAQTADDETTDRQQIHERALAIYCKTNGNMGSGTIMRYKTDYSNVHAAFPDAPKDAKPATASGNYVAANPPCYRFKNSSGRFVTKCPNTTSAKCTNGKALNEDEISSNQGSLDGSSNFQHKSYSGNYPDLHSLYPQAPANAVPAWPASPYTELQNPPCYKYTNKRGLPVTECPGAQFPPEHRYR
jgi:hypothetical protein